MQEKHNLKFRNKLGFVLASVGSAVGMGNIWLFPYRVGQYGGAAFLLVYFFFVALFGYAGLSAEFAFGRLTGTGPIGSYQYALQTRGKKGGGLLGAIPLFGSLGIAIGYAVIVGWVLRYCAGGLTGSLFDTDAEIYFADMTGPFGSLGWHAAVILLTALILFGGVLKGIEKANRIIMPVSYTHLDVYKRQGGTLASSAPAMNTKSNAISLASYSLFSLEAVSYTHLFYRPADLHSVSGIGKTRPFSAYCFCLRPAGRVPGGQTGCQYPFNEAESIARNRLQ